MKRLCVAGIIESGGKHSLHILLGRRGKEPNFGLYVLPGGGVEEGESLEQAFCREIKEETGLTVIPNANRFTHPHLIELHDRIILVAPGIVEHQNFNDEPINNDDLYDIAWHPYSNLPHDISPIIKPILAGRGCIV